MRSELLSLWQSLQYLDKKKMCSHRCHLVARAFYLFPYVTLIPHEKPRQAELSVISHNYKRNYLWICKARGTFKYDPMYCLCDLRNNRAEFDEFWCAFEQLKTFSNWFRASYIFLYLLHSWMKFKFIFSYAVALMFNKEKGGGKKRKTNSSETVLKSCFG